MKYQNQCCSLLWSVIACVVTILLFTSMYFIREDPTSTFSIVVTLIYIVIYGMALVVSIIALFISLVFVVAKFIIDIREEAIERLKNEMKEGAIYTEVVVDEKKDKNDV